MDYYEEFGVSRLASTEEIRQAYKNLARLLHPDQFQEAALRPLAERQMQRINAIYAVLCDPADRRDYDDSLTAARAPAPARWKHWGWAALAAVAASGATWLLLDVPAPPPQSALARPAPAPTPVVASPPLAASLPAETRLEAPPVIAEVAELRRQVERLKADRSQPPAHPRAVETPATESAPPLPAVVVPAPPPPPASPPPPSATSGFAGTWVYIQSPDAPTRRELYPPEYIETVISERHGSLRGRYRGRFRVTDRAISPDVIFQFEGPVQGQKAELPWKGGGGAEGEVQLRLLSQNTLEVKWVATTLGRQMGLGSGTAVLIRRQEP